MLGWIGRLFGIATLMGLAVFGGYIALRASGATITNFEQWQTLVAGLPMPTASDWIANLGIGLHFLMGTVLVLAWPILLSARIRTRHRKVHRWTGRIYVTAGLLAGAGGLSFILTHGTFSRAAAIAFSLWGAVMMPSSVMAYVHARARRFDRHRAWAIRLFAMVLGSWLFDIEIQAWTDWAGGIGMNADGASGPFDLAMLVSVLRSQPAGCRVFHPQHAQAACPAGSPEVAGRGRVRRREPDLRLCDRHGQRHSRGEIWEAPPAAAGCIAAGKPACCFNIE